MPVRVPPTYTKTYLCWGGCCRWYAQQVTSWLSLAPLQRLMVQLPPVVEAVRERYGLHQDLFRNIRYQMRYHIPSSSTGGMYRSAAMVAAGMPAPGHDCCSFAVCPHCLVDAT